MADASHELRTPVSVIQTAAEVTLEREAREDWEYREALTIVTEQSARLKAESLGMCWYSPQVTNHGRSTSGCEDTSSVVI
jgi:hypothetical protein